MRQPKNFKVEVVGRIDYPKPREENKKENTQENIIKEPNTEKTLFKVPEDYNSKVKDHFAFIYNFGKNEKSVTLCVNSCTVDFRTEIYEVIKSNIKDSKEQQKIFESKDLSECMTNIVAYLNHMFGCVPNDKNETYSLMLAKTICRQLRMFFSINGINDSSSYRHIIDYIIAFISVVYPHSNINE